MQEGDPRGLFHGPHPTLPTQSFRPASAPSLDIRGEKGQELDIVYTLGHLHVPEVEASSGQMISIALIIPQPLRLQVLDATWGSTHVSVPADSFPASLDHPCSHRPGENMSAPESSVSTTQPALMSLQVSSALGTGSRGWNPFLHSCSLKKKIKCFLYCSYFISSSVFNLFFSGLNHHHF